jgi:hypothetical protein
VVNGTGGGGTDPGSSGGSSAASSAASGSGESSASRDRSQPEPPPAAADLDADRAAAPSTAAPAPVPPSGGSPRTDNRTKRLVERSASLVLTARPPDLENVADRIVGVADRLGGFVVSASTTSTDGADTQGGGDFLLRIPTDRLPEALAQLSRIAHVSERRQTTDDITREHVSARDRLAEHRAERRSLLRRLSTAATDEQVAAVRARLRAVNRSIAAARADLQRVDNRARYANVAVTLIGDRHAGTSARGHRDDGTWSPADAAGDALRVLEVAAGVLLVALAVALPLGLVIALGVVVARLAARRGRERALDAV